MVKFIRWEPLTVLTTENISLYDEVKIIKESNINYIITLAPNQQQNK